MNDALRLTRRAKELSLESTRLCRQARQLSADNLTTFGISAQKQPLLCQGKGEKPFKLEADKEQHPVLSSAANYQRYDEIFTQYKTALAAYQQHRKEYQQHVNAFHQSAQQGSQPAPSLDIPPFKPLRVLTQDACDRLQAAEAQLHANEVELSQVINDLVARKGQLSQYDYFTRWSQAQSMAMGIQNEAMQFNEGVSNKQSLSTDELHQITHAAMVTGDYTQSAKAFGEVQRRNYIENQEMTRANMHNQIAETFLARLSQLNPSQLRSQAPSADSLNSESQQIAKEFANVQELYQQLEQLNPSLAK